MPLAPHEKKLVKWSPLNTTPQYPNRRSQEQPQSLLQTGIEVTFSLRRIFTWLAIPTFCACYHPHLNSCVNQSSFSDTFSPPSSNLPTYESQGFHTNMPGHVNQGRPKRWAHNKSSTTMVLGLTLTRTWCRTVDCTWRAAAWQAVSEDTGLSVVSYIRSTPSPVSSTPWWSLGSWIKCAATVGQESGQAR